MDKQEKLKIQNRFYIKEGKGYVPLQKGMSIKRRISATQDQIVEKTLHRIYYGSTNGQVYAVFTGPILVLVHEKKDGEYVPAYDIKRKGEVWSINEDGTLRFSHKD